MSEPELRTRPHPPGHANGQQLAYLTAAAWHTQQATEIRRKHYADHGWIGQALAHEKSASHFRRIAAKVARAAAAPEGREP